VGGPLADRLSQRDTRPYTIERAEKEAERLGASLEEHLPELGCGNTDLRERDSDLASLRQHSHVPPGGGLLQSSIIGS